MSGRAPNLRSWALELQGIWKLHVAASAAAVCCSKRSRRVPAACMSDKFGLPTGPDVAPRGGAVVRGLDHYRRWSGSSLNEHGGCSKRAVAAQPSGGPLLRPVGGGRG